MPKCKTDRVVSDVLGQEHLHAITQQVEEMLRSSALSRNNPRWLFYTLY